MTGNGRNSRQMIFAVRHLWLLLRRSHTADWFIRFVAAAVNPDISQTDGAGTK